MLRTPDNLLAAARLLDFPNAFAFLPHRRLVPLEKGQMPPGPTITVDGILYWVTPRLTLCNAAASVFCACFGAILPATMKANAQYDWLLSPEGRRMGWQQVVDRALAAQRINAGSLIVEIAKNRAGNGHVGCGVPNAEDPTQIYVAAAGAQNFARVKADRSFGDLWPSALSFEWLPSPAAIAAQ